MLTSIEPSHPLRALGVPHERCERGQQWAWDGVRFRVLHPLAADYETPRPPNALSCVIQATDAWGRSVLITGDIGRAEEALLVAREGEALHSEWLIVPHHGSKGSSSPAFIAAVAPRDAVVQAGFMNRFGHPAPEVVDRYRAVGANVVRSDRCGAWQWFAGVATCTRQVRQRYWHDLPRAATPQDGATKEAASGGAEVAKFVAPGGDEPPLRPSAAPRGTAHGSAQPDPRQSAGLMEVDGRDGKRR